MLSFLRCLGRGGGWSILEGGLDISGRRGIGGGGESGERTFFGSSVEVEGFSKVIHCRFLWIMGKK